MTNGYTDGYPQDNSNGYMTHGTPADNNVESCASPKMSPEYMTHGMPAEITGVNG